MLPPRGRGLREEAQQRLNIVHRADTIRVLVPRAERGAGSRRAASTSRSVAAQPRARSPPSAHSHIAASAAATRSSLMYLAMRRRVASLKRAVSPISSSFAISFARIFFDK